MLPLKDRNCQTKNKMQLPIYMLIIRNTNMRIQKS